MLREKPRQIQTQSGGRRLSGAESSGYARWLSSGDLPPGVQCVLHTEAFVKGAGLLLRVLTAVPQGTRDEISEIAAISSSRELCPGDASWFLPCFCSKNWDFTDDLSGPSVLFKERGTAAETRSRGQPAKHSAQRRGRHQRRAGRRLANAHGSLCRNYTETS